MSENRQNLIVSTKQCGSIISTSYILWLLVAHSEKLGVYKVQQGRYYQNHCFVGTILFCWDYLNLNSSFIFLLDIDLIAILSNFNGSEMYFSPFVPVPYHSLQEFATTGGIR